SSALVAFPLLSATTYPDGPIRLIVPFPPGGGADGVARLVAKHLSGQVGRPVVVDNKPGADQIIGTLALTNAEADGHTLMLTGDTMMIHKAYGRDLPYD